MLIKIRYPGYVSVLISFVFCSSIINEFEIQFSQRIPGVGPGPNLIETLKYASEGDSGHAPP